MKGLLGIPNTRQILEVVNRLQSDLREAKISTSTKDFANDLQICRFDPRLAEILVTYVKAFYREIPWVRLWQDLAQKPWPQTLGVVLEFARISSSSEDRPWLALLLDAQRSIFPPKNHGLFFIPTQRLPPTLAKEEVEWCLSPYLQAGFVGSQNLVPKNHLFCQVTLIGAWKRLTVLQALRQRSQKGNGPLTVDGYIRACRGLISRRQAQRDLASHAKGRGFTRNKRYA